MVDPYAPPAKPSRTRSFALDLLWRVLRWLLFLVAIVFPGLIVIFGAVTLIMSFFQPTASSRGDFVAGGAVLAITGGVLMIPGAIFFLRRRRHAGSVQSDDEKIALALAAPGAAPVTRGQFDEVFGLPAVPPATSVILPFALHSRPWIGRAWWLAPLTFIGLGLWFALGRHGFRGQVGLWMISSIALGIVVGVVQYAYLYRRRLVVDDLTVSFTDVLGRVTSVPRADVTRVALRTLVTRSVLENRLLMLGPNSGCVLRVPRFGLRYEEASQLAAVLRVPVDPSWDRPATIESLRTEFPGALTWSERHRLLYVLVVMVPIIAFALFLVGLQHSPR